MGAQPEKSLTSREQEGKIRLITSCRCFNLILDPCGNLVRNIVISPFPGNHPSAIWLDCSGWRRVRDQPPTIIQSETQTFCLPFRRLHIIRPDIIRSFIHSRRDHPLGLSRSHQSAVADFHCSVTRLGLTLSRACSGGGKPDSSCVNPKFSPFWVLVARQFSSLTAENDMKWSASTPGPTATFSVPL